MSLISRRFRRKGTAKHTANSIAEVDADAVLITQAQGLMFGSGQGVNAAEKAIRWAR